MKSLSKMSLEELIELHNRTDITRVTWYHLRGHPFTDRFWWCKDFDCEICERIEELTKDTPQRKRLLEENSQE